jgi:hypothetical protein
MQDSDDNQMPDCFGDLNTVFPQGEDGLRHSPETCLACAHKTECLRSAIKGGEGIKVREEKVDRAYESGMMGFFERWSKKKRLDTCRKKKDKQNK